LYGFAFGLVWFLGLNLLSDFGLTFAVGFRLGFDFDFAFDLA
jgi:hypothetical protein